jgi:hypothetical protein
MMPALSVDSPSSFSLHSMPKLSSPRIFAFLMTKSPGRMAPGVANATVSPARQFGAPQTTVSCSAPVSTRAS